MLWFFLLINLLLITKVKSQSWSLNFLSSARSDLAASSTQTQVFFAGGLEPSGEASNVVDIFAPGQQTWSIASLSVARSSLAATSVER